MDALTIQEEAFKRGYEKGKADAVPVAHGRWEDEYGGKYANPRYRCSVCKERALYKFEMDCLCSWKEVQALTPICPYCGAILGGEIIPEGQMVCSNCKESDHDNRDPIDN